ncbi:MAG: hypothetical protein U0835_24295 [Isosphaeraceae bacterium]
MSIRIAVSAVAKVVGSVGLGCGVIGYVASQAGPRMCEVVVHVAASDVEFWVDEDSYRVEAPPDSPFVLPLQPGAHTLSLRRGNQTLHEESFILRPGDHVVKTAWYETQTPEPGSGGAVVPASLDEASVPRPTP